MYFQLNDGLWFTIFKFFVSFFFYINTCVMLQAHSDQSAVKSPPRCIACSSRGSGGRRICGSISLLCSLWSVHGQNPKLLISLKCWAIVVWMNVWMVTSWWAGTLNSNLWGQGRVPFLYPTLLRGRLHWIPPFCSKVTFQVQSVS